MKKVIATVLLLGCWQAVFSRTLMVQVLDKDTGQGLEKVSIIMLQGRERQKLAVTDAQGKARISFKPAGRGQSFLLFRKGYRNISLSSEDILKNKGPYIMTEKTPPLEVKKLRLTQQNGRAWLEWDASESPDTLSYQVYYRQGLHAYQKIADNLTETRLEVSPPAGRTDHYYQVRAQDHNQNRNKGTELHHYESEPRLAVTAWGRVSGRIKGLQGNSGVVFLHPLNLGDSLQVDAAPLRILCQSDGSFSLDQVPAGTYILEAFADSNRNGAWDGNWLGQTAEPRTLLPARKVPADGSLYLEAVVRPVPAGVPHVIYDEQPGYVELYQAAWDMARAKITPGQTRNGFVHAYMDEGFNNHIYQWDTCFMMFFGIYGGADFPAMNSLDNFYLKQRDNGYICRVQNEDTGRDYEPSLQDPSVNPPLYAWVEWSYYRITGDASRMLWALTHLDRYYRWLQNNVRREGGWYFTSNLGSGMDNSPREGQAWGWVDMTAQMGLFAYYMAEMSRVAGIPSARSFYQAEYQALGRLVNTTMWDENQQIYLDVKKNHSLHKKKTIASFWPLLAGLVPAERLPGLLAHLQDPREFWTPHVFPTLSRDEVEYDAKGYYWRGGVWAPTTFMAIKGLEYNGFQDLAYQASRNHLDNMWQVFSSFVPDRKKLPYRESNIPFPAHLDGTRQIWELYSPELPEPGTRWDNQFYGRPEFVGWSGVGPIVLLIENVLGIRLDAPAASILWTLRSEKRQGVRGLWFGGARIDLMMLGIKDGRPVIETAGDRPFTLTVLFQNKSYRFEHRP